MNANELILCYGENLAQMAYDVACAAELDKLIGDRNKTIGLKPNLVVAENASGGATTHPELLEGLIRYLKERCFENLVILEGSWVGARTKEAFRSCGYESLSLRTGVPLIDTQTDRFVEKDCAGLKLRICERALSLDFLINLPVIKGHCQTYLTCALKNLKGLIPNTEKRRFHTLGLHRPIAHLNTALQQGFILADGICGDLNFEEGGNPVYAGRILAGIDPVLVDSYACALMGLPLSDVPYIQMAERLGVGSANLEQAKIRELNRPLTRSSQRQSRRVRELAVHCDARNACSACYAALIHALEKLDDETGLHSLPGRVSIGQDFRGCKGALGVGRCTALFDKNISGCPPTAREIREFLQDL